MSSPTIKREHAPSDSFSRDAPTVAASPAGPTRDAPPPRERLTRGQRFGRYTVAEVLGVGGMGVVYRASDPQLERDVALKVLARRSTDDRWDDRSRLLREAKALARLNHPNVVAVYEVAEEQDELFVAMELVEGEDLKHWLTRSHPPAEVLAVFVAAGRGLSAAHRAGLVHRDFKPANVLVGADGRPRVTDFGLARAPRLHADDGGELSSGTSTSIDLLLTADGLTVGTPAYMAPEQHAGEISPAVDQYALCVALYEALFGGRPFTGDSVDALLEAKRRGPPPPPSGHGVPARIVRAVLRGLAPHPAARFGDTDRLLDALTWDPAVGRRRVAVAGGVIATGTLLAVLATREADPCPDDPAALVGVWDPDVRRTVEAAFFATTRSYAGVTFQTVAGSLDAWTDQWRASHRDACEATRVRAEQSPSLMDQRMACLRDRREALLALTEVLAHADATVVDRAQRLDESLPSPHSCDDTNIVRATIPEPGTDADADAVAALRVRLASVGVQLELGKFAEARTELEALVRDAERTHYEPVMAEAFVSLGFALDALAEPEAATAALQRAVWLAYGHSYDAVVGRAALRLAWNAGNSHDHPHAGLVWVQLAEAALARGPADPEGQARVLNARGALDHTLGHLQDAERAYQASLSLIQTAAGPDHLLVAVASTNLAIVLSEQQRYPEALALQQRALQIRERTQGREHPDAATLLNNMSSVLLGLHRDQEALETNEEALRRLTAILGPAHPLVATALVQRATLEFESQREQQAAVTLGEAIEIMVATRGAGHRDVAVLYNNLGYIEHGLGDNDAALKAFTTALAVHDANGTRGFATALAAEVGAGQALVALGLLDAAKGHFDATLARVREGVSPLPHVVQDAFDGAIEVAQAQGDADEVAALRQEAARHAPPPK